MEELRADLVFEGGGVKGIGLAGAFSGLSAAGYRPECVAGTSAGAIMASLVAAGYTAEELEQVVLHDMDFGRFADETVLDRLGPVGEGAQFLRSRGIHSGRYFHGWIEELLAKKGVATFGDLRRAEDVPVTGPGPHPRQYRLQVIASDLSARSMLVLPKDAGRLGLDPDRLRVADAVRMSMSIPVFFEPVVTDGHVIVDGGLLSNFPVWLFDAPPGMPPVYPTFGLLLVAPGQAAPLLPDRGPVEPIDSDIGYLRAIGETMMEAHDRMYVEQATYARTIPIPTLGVGTTEFGISGARAEALFASGRDAASSFLASWSFRSYTAKFRSGGTPSGRPHV